MDELIRIISEFFYQYGKASAGMPSYRGAFEETVPDEYTTEYDCKVKQTAQS